MRPTSWRLFPKYAMLIIALVAAALAASSAVSFYFSFQEARANLVALQQEKAQGAATRIEQYVLDIEHQLSWTALAGTDADSDRIARRRLDYLKLLRQTPAITDVAWIDPAGIEQLRVSRLEMDKVGAGPDLSASPVFLDAKAGKTHFGEVYFRRGTEPYMTISRPAGTGGGVTAADVNLKFVWDVVSRIQVGQNGIAYAIDAGGNLIAHPDISLVLKHSNLAGLPQVAALERPGQANQQAAARDLQGREVLSAHAEIPALHWTVFVESPVAEAYAPLYRTLLRLALVLAASLVVSIVASFFLARTLVRPLRALEQGAARIGAGDLDRRIDVSTGDELEGLAEQFNQMGAALKASYAGLERKVDERTAELSDALNRQTATAGILQVISNSVADTAPVFDAILQSCERLFGGLHMGITLAGSDGLVHLAAQHGRIDDPGAFERAFPVPLSDQSASGAAILTRRVVQYPDLGAPGVPAAVRRSAEAARTASVVVAPLLWESRAIGTIFVGRREAGAFPEADVALLKTFADQAVIAIQNARLFSEIQAKSRELEQANQHKSEFLANMSHELRTPLNAIIGFSEVLVERIFGELNDKQLEYLRDIHSSGHHLLTLINDILDLSKIEAGRMELELARFDLPMLMNNAITLVRERALRQGLDLRLEVDEAPGEWVADQRKLKQVVVNLLSNAVKFTPSGGSVSLRARWLGEHAVEIAVIDTGVGIAADQQSLVFEEFRQAGGDYLRKSEGTGLGLALARRYVELHGGTIRVESAPGRGSTFAFVLPEHVLEAA